MRVCDVAGALALLLILAPAMLLIAGLVRVQDSGPVLYRHVRIGRNGQPFDCLKFRTMVVDADQKLPDMLASEAHGVEWAASQKLRRDPRVTPLGRLLRIASLDETPQLLNVLKGEMSLVGPRPIVAEEIGRYGRWFADYTRVKPGLTGLWQIMGRNTVPYRRRVAMDVWLTRRRSFGTYLVILVRTPVAVIRGEGAF